MDFQPAGAFADFMPDRHERPSPSSCGAPEIGSAAFIHLGWLWQALADAGRDRRAGFDPDHTTFLLEDEAQESRATVQLPWTLEEEEGPPARVRIQLTAPLFLRRTTAEGKRRHIEQLTFADLLRASLRTLGGLFALYARPLPAAFGELKRAAEAVPLLESAYVPFHQGHWSSRSRRHRALHGVSGSGWYGPVPPALLRWLSWGGRLHTGIDRVSGAGSWTVQAEAADRQPSG